MNLHVFCLFAIFAAVSCQVAVESSRPINAGDVDSTAIQRTGWLLKRIYKPSAFYAKLKKRPSEELNVKFRIFSPDEPGRQRVFSFGKDKERSCEAIAATYRHLATLRPKGCITALDEASTTTPRQLFVSIHGFNMLWKGRAMLRLRDALLRRQEDVRLEADNDACSSAAGTVVLVDYQMGNRALLSSPVSSYYQASLNAESVAEDVARFVQCVVDEEQVSSGVSAERVHLVGFSLGGQVVGMTGRRLTERLGRPIGRITGLDPAGPKFTSHQDVAESLDPTDAVFVDVYHTYTGGLLGLGNERAIGHVDVFVNGLDGLQPACALAIPPLNVFCGHMFALSLFADSLSCSYKAFRCASSAAFFNGSCSMDDVLTVGLDATMPQHEGRYFMLTGGEKPYCLTVDEQQKRAREVAECRSWRCRVMLWTPESVRGVMGVVVEPLAKAVEMMWNGRWAEVRRLRHEVVARLVKSFGVGAASALGVDKRYSVA